MAFARVNDVTLHFSTSGAKQGRVLLFINSLGSDLRIWKTITPAFCGQSWVVTYDKRGHGLSEVPPGPYSIDDFVDDLLGLLDHLDISKAVLVGLSIGGMIAQRLAVRARDRVSALILCDTAAKIGTAEFWAARMRAIETDGLAHVADGILERWFTRDFREKKHDEFGELRAMLINTPIAGYLGACAAIRDADLSAETASIRIPTLCVVGDEDGSTPPDLVRDLAALIPNAGFSIIKGAGHLPCIEQPASLVKLIQGHLQEAGIV